MSVLIIKQIDFTELNLQQVNDQLKLPHSLTFSDLSYIGNRVERLFGIDTEWHKIPNRETGGMDFQLIQLTN